MNELRTTPPKALPASPVLALSAHPGDLLVGSLGPLAAWTRAGLVVTVVVLGDGSGEDGDELASFGVQARQAEVRAALSRMGIPTLRYEGLAQGRLGGHFQLVARIHEMIEDLGVKTLLVPGPHEVDADRRALCCAAVAAMRGHPGRSVRFYGVDTRLETGIHTDTSGLESVIDEVREMVAPERAELLDAGRPLLEVESHLALDYVQDTIRATHGGAPRPRTTAVLSTWNKVQDVLENLEGLRAQTWPFEDIVVVDNCSSDRTADLIREHFPEVRLVVMPHDQYGACETFNIGFASARTELIAILDDDVVLPPEWLERSVERLLAEPETTAVVSTEVVEPGMPKAYREASVAAGDRYMSTFRGCASLARNDALRDAGYYDVRLFIYGNERDLTCRLLNRGFRVLQYPGVEAFHKTPFGVQMGKRSLFYHARNAFLSMLKYAPFGALLKLPFLAIRSVLFRSSEDEAEGAVTDATGTIGIGNAVRRTPGAWWVLVKAGFSVLKNVPYALRRREPVRHEDFELPLK